MYIIVQGQVAVFKNREADELKAEREFLRLASSIVENQFIKTDIAPTNEILDFLDENLAQPLEEKLRGVAGGKRF